MSPRPPELCCPRAPAHKRASRPQVSSFVKTPHRIFRQHPALNLCFYRPFSPATTDGPAPSHLSGARSRLQPCVHIHAMLAAGHAP